MIHSRLIGVGGDEESADRHSAGVGTQIEQSSDPGHGSREHRSVSNPAIRALLLLYRLVG